MAAETYRFGEFCLDVVARRLSRRGEVVALPPLTFDILHLLVRHKGRLVEKEEIIRRVWPNQFIEGNNLTVRVSAIRKLLGDDSERKFIETVPGRGYRFVGRVREGKSGGRDKVVRSLAVLPFVVDGAQQRLGYIAEGVVESLIDCLSRLPNLKVMARSTVFRYGADKEPRDAGVELGVEAVLIGRLRQVNHTLTLSAELIDVGDGSHLWGARYVRQSSDIAELQDVLAGELSESLRATLAAAGGGVTVRPAGNPDAHHLYLKGRYFYNNRRNVRGIRKALAFFRRAVTAAPDHALAYCGLADCYRTLACYGLTPPKRIQPKVKAAIMKALDLDARLGEAHASLASVKADFEWDWAGALRECELSLELSPNNAHAHHVFATVLARVGRVDHAIGELMKALELDPLSLNINISLCKLYYFARRFDEAVGQCRVTLEIEPQFAAVNGILGLIYLQRRQYEKALREFEKTAAFTFGDYKAIGRKSNLPRGHITHLGSDPETIGFMGNAYAQAGRRREARRLLAGLMNLTEIRYVEPHAIALIYIGLGDNGRAFEWLVKAANDRPGMLTYIKVWPLFEPLHSDHRYKDLLRRMRLGP